MPTRPIRRHARVMILGLLTALAWGIADFLVKLLGRRLDTRSALVWTQSLAALLVLAGVLRSGARPLASIAPGIVPLLLLESLVNAVALGLLYLAFRRGAVTVVAPLIGSYGILATLLGAAAGGVLPGIAVLATLAMIALGALLVMLEPAPGGSHGRSGAVAALGSAGASGVSIWLAADRLLPHMAVGDLLLVNFTVLAAAALLWPAGTPLRAPRGGTAIVMVVAIAVGTLAGYAWCNLGLREGIAVVSILSTLSSAVTVLLSIVVLRERPRGLQLAGIALVLLGLPLLAGARELGG